MEQSQSGIVFRIRSEFSCKKRFPYKTLLDLYDRIVATIMSNDAESFSHVEAYGPDVCQIWHAK